MTKNTIKKMLVAVAVSTMAMSGATAYSCSTAPKSEETWNEVTKNLEDGRELTCVISNEVKKLSMSCDWDESKMKENSEVKSKETWKEVTKKLEDGRDLSCVVVNGVQKKAMSCNWEGAK